MQSRRRSAVLGAVLAITAACDSHRITTPAPAPATAPSAAAAPLVIVPANANAAAAEIEADLRETLVELRAVTADPAAVRRAVRLQPALAADLAIMPGRLEEAARQLEAIGIMREEHRVLFSALKREVLSLLPAAKE